MERYRMFFVTTVVAVLLLWPDRHAASFALTSAALAASSSSLQMTSTPWGVSRTPVISLLGMVVRGAAIRPILPEHALERAIGADQRKALTIGPQEPTVGESQFTDVYWPGHAMADRRIVEAHAPFLADVALRKLRAVRDHLVNAALADDVDHRPVHEPRPYAARPRHDTAGTPDLVHLAGARVLSVANQRQGEPNAFARRVVHVDVPLEGLRAAVGDPAVLGQTHDPRQLVPARLLTVPDDACRRRDPGGVAARHKTRRAGADDQQSGPADDAADDTGSDGRERGGCHGHLQSIGRHQSPVFAVTRTEARVIQRWAQLEGKTPVQTVADYLTAHLEHRRDEIIRTDGQTKQQQYDALTPAKQAEVDALLDGV